MESPPSHVHHESFVNRHFERVAAEASVLPYNKRPHHLSGKANCQMVPSSRRVGQTRPISEGTKAVTKYTSSTVNLPPLELKLR
ncbi:Histone H2B (s) [Orchesella cincta]|uniref:Histone H2B (S) n=1 Tax=Orchesella cincta TaxID=48709 RepID=A0A1D2M421_ORCCI|nr:Histone H2B (s) [Orchesella cincta]